MLVEAALLRAVISPRAAVRVCFVAVRSMTLVSMWNFSATAMPSAMSSPKFRLLSQGRQMPTVSSQASLQRMPVSALSLPPLLP